MQECRWLCSRGRGCWRRRRRRRPSGRAGEMQSTPSWDLRPLAQRRAEKRAEGSGKVHVRSGVS
eukprot:487675-Pleurochrysis_carterae.AAC.5